MTVLTTNLKEFLINVVHADVSIKDMFDEDFFFKFFSFDYASYELPTEEERERVKRVCGISDIERIEEIWIRALSDHYENTYMAEYYKQMIEEIEKVVEKSFENLIEFFGDELDEAGLDVKTIERFEIQFDWDNNKLLIEGDFTALEVILNEIMRGIGWCYYDSLEEFIECNGDDQEKRIKDHLYHLESIESVYGTCYNFFRVNGLCELDRYHIFGDCEVTDMELKEAMYY